VTRLSATPSLKQGFYLSTYYIRGFWNPLYHSRPVFHEPQAPRWLKAISAQYGEGATVHAAKDVRPSVGTRVDPAWVLAAAHQLDREVLKPCFVWVEVIAEWDDVARPADRYERLLAHRHEMGAR
jgi:hypothetical protein